MKTGFSSFMSQRHLIASHLLPGGWILTRWRGGPHALEITSPGGSLTLPWSKARRVLPDHVLAEAQSLLDYLEREEV